MERELVQDFLRGVLTGQIGLDTIVGEVDFDEPTTLRDACVEWAAEVSDEKANETLVEQAFAEVVGKLLAAL